MKKFDIGFRCPKCGHYGMLVMPFANDYILSVLMYMYILRMNNDDMYYYMLAHKDEHVSCLIVCEICHLMEQKQLSYNEIIEMG